MGKIDLRRELKAYYSPGTKTVQVVTIPRFKFVMIDGKIESGEEPKTSAEFQEAMTALYGITFTLKFMSKLQKENPIDYSVMGLEGLWWVEGGEFNIHRKDNLSWTVMIMQPPHITEEIYQDALAQLAKKKPSPRLSQLRFEEFEEGPCIQMMHIGPYDTEPDTVDKMMAFASENGYRIGGRHHEIYLSDPRRSAPEKWKTILRYPIAGV